MEVLSNMESALSAGDTKNSTEIAAALRRMETELSEREGMQKELCGLIDDLELHISELSAQLAEVHARLETERSKAEEEIGLLSGELARQKMAVGAVNQELESFSYSVSHDLRAPLRHLMGFSGALLEDFAATLDPTARTYLDCIVRAGHKMEHLVEALLILSRITRQEMTLVDLDLGLMARQCAASLKETDPGRRVTFQIAEELSVHADQQLMKVAVEHLFGNAWKFSGKKEAATIEFGRKEEEGSAVYYLRDDGAGFDTRYADRLFAPFQRMHREDEFPGLGTGLATVQRIIHRHGGRIWAEARVDGGATFFFTLSH